jgi:thiol:disulfide interchange protein DsbD
MPQANSSREHRTKSLATFYALGVWGWPFGTWGTYFVTPAGKPVGWGFRLQSPFFVVFLGVLFTLIALNLWGVFEVRQAVPAFLSALNSKNPMA